jgi:copper chaperone CopZ
MATVVDPSAVTETCPGCSTKARRVASLTVRSLVKPQLVDRVREEPYRFCALPTCDVVYFNEADPANRFLRSDVRVRVGQKETTPPFPVCYCFDWTTEDVEREFRLTGSTTIPKRIKEKIRLGFCRCETMNPQGTCCLGNVNLAVKEVQARLATPGGATTQSQDGNRQGPVAGIAATGRTRVRGAWLATLGAVFTAVVGSACCWLPLLLIAFGFSAAGVGSLFEQYRLHFLCATFLLLGVAWYLTYRPALQRTWASLRGRPLPPLEGAEGCCGPAACCAGQAEAVAGPSARRFTPRRFNQVMLWLATVVILLFALFPRWSGLVFGGGTSQPLSAQDNQQRVLLEIQGMDCGGCAATVRQALRQVPGVAQAEVDYHRAEAVVLVQPGSGVGADTLIRAVEEAGYQAHLKK